MSVELSEEQISELARPLVSVAERFYENPDNVAKFEKWLREKEETYAHE